jgi:biopolymer transport protein ExbD
MNQEVRKLLQQDVELDMTPMIDCVFLLMIFFALVIDISQKNLEDLVLPRATFRQLDDKPAENRPILNVLQDGSVVYNQAVVYEPRRHGADFEPVRALLRSIRQAGLLQKKLALEDATQRTGRLRDPILIRADKWTEWHYVAAVMQQCNQPDIGFWKVELALSEVDRELPGNGPRGGGK